MEIVPQKDLFTLNSFKYGTISCFRNDQAFVVAMRSGRIFEQVLVETELQPFFKNARTILDIGGHIGSHTIMYHKINPTATIHVFEPQKKMASVLDLNVRRNCDPSKVHIYNSAVGHKHGDARMSNTVEDGTTPNTPIEYGTGRIFNLGGMALGSDGESVQMCTIDEMNLENVDYMKIDVEGFEPLVLLGAEQTIKKWQPTICYESNAKKVTPAMESYFNLKANEIPTSANILRDWGYTDIRPLKTSNDNFLAVSPLSI